jgi:hypothetical protein
MRAVEMLRGPDHTLSFRHLGIILAYEVAHATASA